MATRKTELIDATTIWKPRIAKRKLTASKPLMRIEIGYTSEKQKKRTRNNSNPIYGRNRTIQHQQIKRNFIDAKMNEKTINNVAKAAMQIERHHRAAKLDLPLLRLNHNINCDNIEQMMNDSNNEQPLLSISECYADFIQLNEVDIDDIAYSISDALVRENLNYDLSEADVEYHNRLLFMREDTIYKVASNDPNQPTIYLFINTQRKDEYLICQRKDDVNTWICDSNCIQFNADKFATQNQLNGKLFCIHCVLAELIESHENPTDLQIKNLGKWSASDSHVAIYDVRHCAAGPKRWIFFMIYETRPLCVWLSNNGKLHCGACNKPRGCQHTKMLDDEMKQRLQSEEYEILRGKGDYERVVCLKLSKYAFIE